MVVDGSSDYKALILVVDDDDSFLELQKIYLKRFGYSVVVAGNGYEALNLFQQQVPDLVLLDAQMPHMDGFETCRALKKIPGGDKVPVLMVTGLSSGESINKIFQAGAEEYISKPISPELLRQRIRRILEYKRSFDALQEKEQQMRLATDSQTDAIITANQSGHIIFWNLGAKHIFGFTNEEILGAPLTRIMPVRFAKMHGRAIQKVQETGLSKMSGKLQELIGLRRNGEEFPLEISITHWTSGQKMFFSAVIRDITERKRALSGQEGLALFDSHIIDQILVIARRFYSEQTGLLGFHHVKSIMENVFLAGLRREEDLPVQVSVCLTGTDIVPEDETSDLAYMRFDSPRLFSVDTLVKLGPGLDSATTSLAVCSKKSNPKVLEIWGVLFSSVRGGSHMSPFPLPKRHPPVLTISTKKSGSLLIRWGRRTLASFQAGHFFEPVSNPFESCQVGRQIYQIVSNHPEYGQNGEAYWEIYRAFLSFLLVNTAEKNTGGTIVWLPEQWIVPCQQAIVARYPLVESPEGARIINKHCQSETAWLEKKSQGVILGQDDQYQKLEEDLLDSKRLLIEHAELLSNLARVDGAVIISPRLRVLSFGSILTAKTWGGKVEYGYNSGSFQKMAVDLSKYGTRHNSAVDFVAKFPGAVAFVLSHDGPVSALVKHDDTVLWLPDYISNIQ